MPVNRFKDYSPNKPHLVRPGGLKGEVQDLRKDLDDWSIEVSNAIDAGTGGITELTGDVTTAVGTGSQAATVEGLQGNPVSNAAPALNEVLTWDGAQWAPAVGGGGGGSPGGVANSIQTNDGSGGFSGDANLTYDGTTLKMISVPGGDTEFFAVNAGDLSVKVYDSVGGNVDSVKLELAKVTVDSSAGAGTATLVLETITDGTPRINSNGGTGPLDLAIGELRVNTAPGAAGEVLTSNGPGVAPTWQAGGSGGITDLTGDVTASGPGSAAATVAKIQGYAVSLTAPTSNQILQWISGTSEWTPTANGVGLGSRVHLVVEGGAYASLQAAVTAASANDVILVGPTGTVASGSWGDVTFPAQKRLSVIGLNGARGTSVRIGKVTFAPTSGLNINENEIFLRGLLINADFAGSQGVLFGGTALARLRMADCFVFNSGASGDCVVMNNAATGGGTASSLQLDGCTIQTANTTSVLLKNVSGYTVVRDCSLDGGQYALQGVAGLVECFKSFFEMNAAAREVVRVEGASVALTYCRIINSNATGIGANITTAYASTGALFGMNNSVFLVGGASPTTPYCVKGVAGALYAYGQVTYGASPRCQNTLIFAQSAQVHTSVV